MPCRPDNRTSVGIAGARQGHAVLLPAAQVDALLSNLCLVTCSLGASAELCVTLLVGQLACKPLPLQLQFAGRPGWLLCAKLATNGAINQHQRQPSEGTHPRAACPGQAAGRTPPARCYTCRAK